MGNGKRDPNALYCDDPSLTKQSFAEECDVNEIIRRAANGIDVSGQLNNKIAQYGDFTGVPDFHESMNIVARAKGMFDQLPWQLKERFHQDPGEMVQFMNDENNREEAVKLGLVNPKKEEAKAPKGAGRGTENGSEEPTAQKNT